MFERTRVLILSDRNAAREALLKEMAEDERQSVEAELDALEREEADRVEREKARARQAEALTDARKKLADARNSQHKWADSFDRALSDACKAFEALEELSVEVARLENFTGDGSGKRPVIVGHARTGALVAAFWDRARPLAKRIGLRPVAGTNKSIKPLASIYPADRR
ncbi:hypothetical protein [uncultured Ruegeria sp.]|uniref:hypothetical protein n=1 Tax=uncultured Ruegeria sp. TaxID=259304 RepID=UPI00260FA64F|nr:hypothetical protein [uncultured Ruegeria sp.]